MGEWVGLGIKVGFRGLDNLLNDLFNKQGIWDKIKQI